MMIAHAGKELVLTMSLVSLVLAGCLADPDDEPDDGGDVDSPPIRSFSERIVADYDNNQHEAFLAVSSDGEVILTCAHGLFSRPAFMFASTDGGETFQELEADVPGVSGDCDVAISNESWTFLHSTVAGATIASTQDGGESWIINPLSAIPVNGLADRPWIEYDDEVLLLTYMPSATQPGTIGFTRSLDHGQTWSTPAWLIPPDPERPNVIQGRLLNDADGRLYVPLAQGHTPANAVGVVPVRFGFAMSSDHGASWEYQHAFDAMAQLINPVGVSIAGDVFHWTYVTNRAGPTDMADNALVARSSGDGTTWSDEILVGEGVRWPRPWAVGHPDGYSDVLWQQAGGPFGGAEDIARWHIHRIHANGTVEVIGEDLVSDYGRAFAEFAELARRPDGRLLASIPDLDQDHGVIRLLEEIETAS